MWEITIISLLYLIHCGLAQQCVEFDLNSAPASGTTCSPYVSSQISFQKVILNLIIVYYCSKPTICALYSFNKCVLYIRLVYFIFDVLKVWVPLLPNAIKEVDNFFNTTIFWQVKAVEPILPFYCFDALVSLLCNAAYPPCNYSDGPFSSKYLTK